jgi:hypothetical protein
MNRRGAAAIAIALLVPLVSAGCSSRAGLGAFERGEQALAAMPLPHGFTRHLPSHGTLGSSRCVDTESQVCLYTKLATGAAARLVEPLLGDRAYVDPSSNCSDSTHRRAFPCTIRGFLGPQAAAVVIAPHIVGLPAGRRAPPGVQLVNPGIKFHDYYEGNDVTVELTRG